MTTLNGSRIPENDFRDAGRFIEHAIPAIVRSLPTNFHVVEDLQERDCSVEPMGQDPYSRSKYHFNLVTEVVAEEEAINIINQAEAVFTANGWKREGRFDRRGRGSGTEIEKVVFSIWPTRDVGLTIHLKHEAPSGSHTVRIVLVTSCFELRDGPRQPQDFSLNLYANTGEG